MKNSEIKERMDAFCQRRQKERQEQMPLGTQNALNTLLSLIKTGGECEQAIAALHKKQNELAPDDDDCPDHLGNYMWDAGCPTCVR